MRSWSIKHRAWGAEAGTLSRGHGGSISLSPMIRGSAGFTLVEVMVAMVILSVGFMTMAGVAASVMRGNAHSSRMTTATTLAQEKMEEIRRLGYSGIPDAETTTVEAYDSIAHYNSYERIVSTAAHAADGIKMITVTVYWDSGSRKVVLRTILAE